MNLELIGDRSEMQLLGYKSRPSHFTITIDRESLVFRLFMEIQLMTYVGLTAGVLTTISFLPQAIRAWKTKSTNDISLAMFLCFCTGVVLWVIYGFFTSNLPVFLANFVTFILAFSILVCKLKYG